jgi:hypothetical protein
VIAAQEEEHITSFDCGFSRSRITLLSDSTLVQGRCIVDEFGRLSSDSVTFISSLYPNTDFKNINFGRNFNTLTKIISPERGSPLKYLSLSNNSGININFSYGSYDDMTPFPNLLDDKESQYDPRYVKRPQEAWDEDDLDEVKIEKLKNAITRFKQFQLQYGSVTKFSGIIDGKLYGDAPIAGGMPQLLKDKGYDYLDFDYLPSGYPGDLFGYSIALHNNKLIVGSPFSAFSKEEIYPWPYYINGGAESGIELCYNGGAGSVYIFEQTFNGSGLHGSKDAWEFIQKLKPSSVNIGLTGDKFGYDVDINSDIVAVGAPGHSFGNLSIDGTGEFIRKSFNEEFNIPSHQVIDLGNSGIRDSLENDGSPVYNNGAIFTFENKITDWNNKKQKWTYIEKVVPQGSGSRTENNVNDGFGKSISLDRSNRSDADYTLVGGAYNHSYSSSGTNELLNAGSAYSHDIMLRQPVPISPNPNTYIDAKVFGEKNNFGIPSVRLLITNNHENNQVYYASGVVYANNNGDIFIEVSGQDPAAKGFITHRPFIESVDGQYSYGMPISSGFNLFIDSKSQTDQNMNIFTRVDDSANVYNSVGLYNGAILNFVSGIPSGLGLFLDCPEPITISESGLFLFTASGVGIYTDTLNLRIRGK